MSIDVPIKRHRMDDWLKRSNQYIYMLLCRDSLQSWRQKKTESEGWKKTFHANGNRNKSGVAILISNNVNFKTMSVTKGEEEHDIKTNGSIQEDDITSMNTYTPNIGTCK